MFIKNKDLKTRLTLGLGVGISFILKTATEQNF
jgi:hypothetical protein